MRLSAQRIKPPLWIGIALIAALALGGFAVAVAISVIPPLGIVLPLGIAFAFWALARPQDALLIAIFFIPFERIAMLFPPTARGDVTVLSTLTVPKLMLLAVLICFVLRTLASRDPNPILRLRQTPVPLLALALLGWTFLSLANAPFLPHFFGQQARLVNVLLLFMLMINLIVDSRRLLAVFRVFTASYLVIGLIGLLEIVTQEHALTLLGHPVPELPYTLHEDRFRVIGPSGDPDVLAISLVLGAISAMIVMRTSPRRWIKLPLLALLAVFLVVIFGTGSRAGLISLLLASVVFLLLAKIRFKPLLLTAGLAVSILLFLGYTYFGSDLSARRYTGEAGMQSILYRVGWIKMCVDITLDHPLIGVGTANFMTVYNRYVNSMVPRDPFFAHNTFAQLAAENGIPALIILLSIYAVSLALNYRVMRTTRDPALREAATGLLALIIGFGFFAATVYTVTNQFFWMLFALSVIISHIESTTPARSPYHEAFPDPDSADDPDGRDPNGGSQHPAADRPPSAQHV